MSAGDRDTLALLIGRTFTYSDPSIYVAEDMPGDTFRIGDVRFSTKALADVLLASDWLREQRAKAWDNGVDTAGQYAEQPWIVDEECKPLNPHRTTEDTDAH